jgi:hypothetical protein
LQDAQQLGLHLEGHFPNFVEQQRAPLRLFEKAFALALRIRKRPLGVAEQLGLEQARGHGCAVDGDERHCGSPTLRVQSARDQFLAGATFAAQEHRRVRVSYPPDHVVH